MEPSQLDELLQREGRLDSSGTFTVDAARARIKLSRYLMAPDMPLAKLVQAGVAAGSQHVQVSLQPPGLDQDHEFVVRFYAPDSQQLGLDVIARGLEEPLSLPQESAAAHLCRGILASQHPRSRRVMWRLFESGRCDWVEVDQGVVLLGRDASDRSPTAVLAEVRLANPTQPELARVRERFGYSPVRIKIENKVMEPVWGREEQDGWGPLYRLGEYYAFTEGGDRLGLPVRRSAWTVGPEGGVRVPGLGAAHLGYLQGEPSKDWTCECTLAVPAQVGRLAARRASRLILVRHGMWLQEKPISLPCPSVLAVAAARGLQLDLSDQVVENEAYQALVERLQARTQTLVEALGRRLYDLQIPNRGRGALEAGVSALGVGGLGLFWLAAAFPQIGVPLVLGGSAVGLAGAGLVYRRTARHWNPDAAAKIRAEFEAFQRERG